ncbi:hypothetical protein GCM10027416_11190 [Okibacterium endophyticum]
MPEHVFESRSSSSASYKFWLGALFSALAVVIAVILVGALGFRGLETAGCSPECSGSSLMMTLYLYVGYCVVVVAAGFIVMAMNRRRTWAWLTPLFALVAVIAGFLIANIAAGAILQA